MSARFAAVMIRNSALRLKNGKEKVVTKTAG